MTTQNGQNDTSLVEAYNQMMSRVRDSIDNAEAHAIPTLQKAIEQARDQAIHLGEVSLEDAEEIGNYIKRDINDAAEYLMETSHEFSEWLMLDINIIEQKVLELFLSVADKTRIELEQLSRGTGKAQHTSDMRMQNNEYKSGEITGPGTLICKQCQKIIQFNTTNSIPLCSQCGEQYFKRAEP